MKLDSIEINGFKGFQSCRINFNPNLNIFIGSNATGKTTILDAIATGFYELTRNYTGGGMVVPNLELSSHHVNYNSNSILINSTIIDFPKFNKDFKYAVEYGTKFIDQTWWNSEFNKWFNNELDKGDAEIPIIKYYPANRGSDNYSDQNIFHGAYRMAQLETWSNLYQNNLSYSKFLHWFFDNENNELRLQKSNMDFTIESPKLRDVRKAIEKTFKTLAFGDYNLFSKQIEVKSSSKLVPTLILVRKGTNSEIRLDNMSAGQKAIITLVADIAYNLSLANNFKQQGEDFLTGKGIVLIDEIETHLHPKWQREIVNILTEVFPNIQFFIATHSPQVISSVNSNNVFVCDDFNIEKINLKTKGEDTNSLLKYIFEATERPKPYIKLIDEFDALIENKGEIEKLRRIISEIENLYEEDKSSPISNLIDELNIKLSAYQFDKEYEEN